MNDLRQREGIAAKALEFLILCAARTGAVIGAVWPEIDFKNKIWTVPPSRAGTKITGEVLKPRRVPLSDVVVELLQALPREKGNPHIFVGGQTGKSLSNMAMAELLKGMAPPSTTPGKIATAHGMRSSFKDWCAECTNYANEISEMALWHVIGDKTEAAYRRGDLFEKRRRLMRDWARFCGSRVDATAEVVPARRR